MEYTSNTWANKAGRIYTIIYNNNYARLPLLVRAYHETTGMGTFYTHNLAHDLADFRNGVDIDDLEWEVPYEFLAEVENQQEIDWEQGEYNRSDMNIAAVIADDIVSDSESDYIVIARNGVVDWDAINRAGLDTASPQIESLKESGQ